MMVSQAERDIRDAVVARLRLLRPSARIIHELNVSGSGSNRIDVAAVTPIAIFGVEIKSERDTLDRLTEQWPAFTACCHVAIVAAHERHFREYRHEHLRDDLPGELYLDHPLFFKIGRERDRVWRYPEPELDRWNRGPWHIPIRDDLDARQPGAWSLLSMLWADELREECARHGLPAGRRVAMPKLITSMVWHMTGREIAEAVCRRLRSREFAAADPPMTDMRACASAPPESVTERAPAPQKALPLAIAEPSHG